MAQVWAMEAILAPNSAMRNERGERELGIKKQQNNRSCEPLPTGVSCPTLS